MVYLWWNGLFAVSVALAILNGIREWLSHGRPQSISHTVGPVTNGLKDRGIMNRDSEVTERGVDCFRGHKEQRGCL